MKVRLTDSQKARIGGFVVITGVFFFVTTLIYHRIYVPDQLRKYGRYTIATTGDQYLVLKDGMKVRYHYHVNGVRYEGRFGKTDLIRPHGQKYLIIFSAKNPSINDLVYVKPVPEEYHSPPPEGWEKPPYYDTNLIFNEYR